ncbi:hypothetical protein, partial [Thiolapillus sp.]|uniref:hypothetical protein n=1 Tax=Thiolapillus sp. TaxID=2017437 RepID=UPI003AF8805C
LQTLKIGQLKRQASMEGGGGTNQQGGNVTNSRKTPGVGRQREGWRLSPGKPRHTQHTTRAAERPADKQKTIRQT